MIVLSSLACEQEDYGALQINAPQDGEYEIFRILGDSALQFVSMEMGFYNKVLRLKSGNYLVLADCSFKTVFVDPGKTSTLIAHAIRFVPPIPVKDDDIFSIQCNRYQKTHPPQIIKNRFNLVMFSGQQDLLVGMKPLHLDLSGDQVETPQVLNFDLSAIRVEHVLESSKIELPPYFVSPSDGHLSITQSQKIGSWLFLLPGQYQITVNGSREERTLAPKDAASLIPAYLQFEAPPDIDLSKFSAIRGEPYLVEVNEHFAFLTDKIYPLMPGDLSYRLHDSNRHEGQTLSAGTLKTIKLRSIQIQLNCGPWEWECLGKRDVNIYEKEAVYPFIESSSDIPILFSHDNDVQVELEGSRGLRRLVPASVRSAIFETGQILLVPKPSVHASHLTYLVRLEAESPSLSGYSHDIPYTKITSLPLIEGSYSLNHYYFLGHNFATTTRNSSKTNVTFNKGDTRTVSFEYFLPEHKGTANPPTIKSSASTKTSQSKFRIY